MNREAISMMMAAMDMLPDNRTRTKFLVDITMGDKSGLDAESFLSIEQEMSIRYFSGAGLEFVRELKLTWTWHAPVGKKWKGDSDLQWLGHATLHFMSSVLSGSSGDDTTISMLSEFYAAVVFFADMLVGGNSMASAKKLLREFGEECEKASLSGLFITWLDEDENLEHPKELRDAFAEGVIKHKGAWKVLGEICHGNEAEQPAQ